MSGEPPTRTATVAAPVIWSGTASGAEVKAAVCPGMSTAAWLLTCRGLPRHVNSQAAGSEGSQPGQDGHRCGRTAGRVDDRLRRPGQPHRGMRGPAESRVPGGRGDAEHLLVTRRVVAAVPAHSKPGLAGTGVPRLEPALEPLLGKRVHPAGFLITAVVPAVVPDHAGRCSVVPNGLVVR